MRGNGELKGTGQRRNTHALSEAAHDSQIRLQDVYRSERDKVAKIKAGKLALTAGNRNVCTAPYLRLAGFIVGIHRLLEPGQITRLDLAGEALGFAHAEGAVRVDHDGNLRPQRRPCRLYARRRRIHVAVHDAHAHLHRPEATAVNVALQLRPNAVHPGPAATGIGWLVLTAFSPQELIHWHLERLTQKIPQGHINPADG